MTSPDGKIVISGAIFFSIWYGFSHISHLNSVLLPAGALFSNVHASQFHLTSFIELVRSGTGFSALVDTRSVCNSISWLEYVFGDIICCWDDDQCLAGIVVVKPVNHLYHLFVRSDLQSQGIGRILFTMADDRVFSESATRLATVNSSLNAVEVYRRLGFEPLASVQNVGGVRFLPMSRVDLGLGFSQPGSES